MKKHKLKLENIELESFDTIKHSNLETARGGGMITFFVSCPIQPTLVSLPCCPPRTFDGAPGCYPPPEL